MSAKPTPARRRRRSKAGNLEALRREMWHAVRRVSDLLDDPEAETAELIRAANALAALGNSYRGVTEASELEARLTALEEALKEPQAPTGQRRAA